jgi:hypothetical protein
MPARFAQPEHSYLVGSFRIEDKEKLSILPANMNISIYSVAEAINCQI